MKKEDMEKLEQDLRDLPATVKLVIYQKGSDSFSKDIREFAQAVLVHRKKSKPEKHRPEKESKKMLTHELADIIGLVIMNANFFEIDLESAIREKWLDKIAL